MRHFGSLAAMKGRGNGFAVSFTPGKRRPWALEPGGVLYLRKHAEPSFEFKDTGHGLFDLNLFRIKCLAHLITFKVLLATGLIKVNKFFWALIDLINPSVGPVLHQFKAGEKGKKPSRAAAGVEGGPTAGGLMMICEIFFITVTEFQP
jgi:hypothetical protein